MSGFRADELRSADVEHVRSRFDDKHTALSANDCWEWQAYRMPRGDGMIRVGGRMMLAHRVAYALHRGDVPAGMTIDHLCHNPSCVNPDHLEVVPVSVNVLRCETRESANAAKSHCPQGHPYDAENTYVYKKRRGGTQRQCLTCMKERRRAGR